jgi:hypothetical protein
MTTSKDYPWLDFDWPISSGYKKDKKSRITHIPHMDLSKFIWLATVGRMAMKEGTEFGPASQANPYRFAPSFADALGSYASALATNWTTGQVTHPGIRPGSVTVYYEDSFSANCGGVTTATDPKGEIVISNCTSVTKYGIYNSNQHSEQGSPLIPVSETWYKEEDDFRPGTPFKLKGCVEGANNRWFRVRSTRRVGSTLYIKVDNNNYQQQELIACAAGGTLTCSFGGDWYTLRGAQGNCSAGYMNGGATNSFFAGLPDSVYCSGSRDRWWSQKDLYHRYYGDSKGPNDGRPPSGGQHSIDFNKDWVRCPNPNLYSTYDTNCHRYCIDCETDGSISQGDYEQFIGVFPASKYLPKQVDPKEVISPHYYEDSQSIRWKYGSKVPLKALQITNPATLGPIQGVFEAGYMTQSQNFIAASSDRQYGSVYAVEATGTNSGTYAFNGINPDGGLTMQAKKINRKYDDAIQNMVELAVEELGWCWPVNQTYKLNWLTLYAAQPLSIHFERYLNGTETGTYTFAQAYTDHGLSAYDASHEPQQPAYPLMNDELWGENGSAFELILSILGPSYYDWRYDDQTPYMSKRVLDIRWRFRAQTDYTRSWPSFPCQIHGHTVNNPTEYMNAVLPYPVGTWRRVWKYSLGRRSPCKMRAVEAGDPVCHVYANYACDPNNDTIEMPMFGHIRMSAPADTDYYSDNGWTNTGNVSGKTWTKSGSDVSSHFKPGWTVWAKVSGQYKSYRVSQCIYNGTDTIVTLEDDFQTDHPSTLYGDDDLADRHDGIIVDNAVTYSKKNVMYCLNACLAVLKKLKYKQEEVNLNLVSEYQEVGGGYYYPTLADWHPVGNAGINAFWASHSVIHLWGAVSWCSVGWYFGGNRETEYVTNSGRAAIHFYDDIPWIDDGRLPLVLVHVWRFPDFGPQYENAVEPMGVEGIVNIVVGSNEHKYQYVRLNNQYSEKWVDGGYTHYYYELRAIQGRTGAYINPKPTWSKANIEVQMADKFMIEFDWAKYPDSIWNRTKERGDYGYIDPAGNDVNPPVTENEFFVQPTLYDKNMLNYPAYKDNLADEDDYIPQWRIKAEMTLMEDLEDNGVFYQFDFTHTTHEADANKMDAEQAERKYDKLLAISGTTGDDDDAWAAYDALINQWTVTACSRDNAPTPNTGIPSEPVAILLNEPVFPCSLRSKTVTADLYNHGEGPADYTGLCRINIDITGAHTEYWDWVKFDVPIIPAGDSGNFIIQRSLDKINWTTMPQNLEPMLWNYSTGQQNVSVASRAPGMALGAGCFWFPAGALWQRYYYRIRYFNSSKNKGGKWFKTTLADGCQLKISASGNFKAKVNGTEYNLPYEGWFPKNSTVTVEATNGSFGAWQVTKPANIGYSYENPWAITLSDDYDITPVSF